MATQEAKVAEPEFDFSGFFKVSFKRNKPEVPTGRQSVVNRSQSDTTTDRKKAVVSLIKQNSQARAADLIEVVGLSDGRVRALLREMVNDGTIEKIGNNRYAYYVLKQD
ncbi:MAG: winged helix-turn-helix transcriptional regulator [Planctomycetaceae bacterium]|nr:winged helix-turn-helix transcriptional regulator [Planctomycetaceae bacterium]